jgi:ribosomal protein S18 acetylase RimI-like enzyme
MVAIDMVIRDYDPADAKALMELFHATVHAVCRSDYSPEQLSAWSPQSGQDVKRWKERFATTRPFVAVGGDAALGFLELGRDGHIDCLYVRHDRQRQGIGSRLMDHAVAEAYRASLRRLDAEVSITAFAFFERHGFVVTRAQEVECNGQRLKNFVMHRMLAAV